MPLSDDAKAELADAIRIVREDRFEKFARESLVRKRQVDEDDEEEDELITKDSKDPKAPPKKEPKQEDIPPVRKSGYWGELGID